MDEEVARYRKKKPQNSKSAKRSDHKHQYERAICIHVNNFNHEIRSFYWGNRCAICGRGNGIELDNSDFRKDEWKNYHGWGHDMFLSKEEILAKFPNYPVYETDPDDMFKEIRIR